jgi:predicted DsbA family dithiol-disulfide isomerase
MALIAIQAGLNGKFWEANDHIYRMAQDIGSVDTPLLAEHIGLPADELASALTDQNSRRILLEDIRAGMRLGIAGTPSYLIDGVVYEGHIPDTILMQTGKGE